MLLGLGGFAHSGKDSVADILARDHGFQKTYMSKPLEQALLILNPQIFCSLPALRVGEDPTGRDVVKQKLTDFDVWEKFLSYSDVRQILTYDESKLMHEVRRLLQVLGSEIGRNMFGEDCWVKMVFREVDDWLAAGCDVVVTGIRYRNELAAIRQRGGVSLWVNRPGIKAVNKHSSDNTLGPQDLDGTMGNDGTLEDLARYVADGVLPDLRAWAAPRNHRYVGCSEGTFYSGSSPIVKDI